MSYSDKVLTYPKWLSMYFLADSKLIIFITHLARNIHTFDCFNK